MSGPKVGLDIVAVLAQGAAWDSAVSKQLIDSLTARADEGRRLRQMVLNLAETCDSRALSRKLFSLVEASYDEQDDELLS